MSNKQKLKISRKAVRYALTNPSNRSFYSGILVLLLLSAATAYYGQTLFAAVIALLGIGGFCALVGSSLVEYATAEAHNKFALLSGWVKSATSEEERARRQAVWQDNDMDSALTVANLSYDGPRYNVDGSLMLPGNYAVDINGNAYGATSLSSAVFNSDTNSWVDPALAYESPLANYNSDSGYGEGSYAGNSTDIGTKFD